MGEKADGGKADSPSTQLAPDAVEAPDPSSKEPGETNGADDFDGKAVPGAESDR